MSALTVLHRHGDEIQEHIEATDRKISEAMSLLKKLNEQQQRAFAERDEIADAIAKLSGIPVPGKKETRR